MAPTTRAKGSSNSTHEMTKNSTTSVPSMPQMDERKDHLSALPQELLDMICNHLDPADQVALKLCSRGFFTWVRWSIDYWYGHTRNSRERYRIRCYTEDPKSEKLHCLLCMKTHARSAFLSHMLSQPGTSRFCRKVKESVLMFGQSGLRFDTLREFLESAKQEEQDGSILYHVPDTYKEIYPAGFTSPAFYYPMEHRLEGHWHYPSSHRRSVKGDLIMKQMLQRKGDSIFLTSTMCLHAYRQKHELSGVGSRWVLIGMVTDQCPCPHIIHYWGKMSQSPLCSLYSTDPEERVSVLKDTCSLCQAQIEISLDDHQDPVVKVVRNLGPCEDRQDPRWLRHLSPSGLNYNDSTIKGLEEIGRRRGSEPWVLFQPTPVKDVLRAFNGRSSLRLRNVSTKVFQRDEEQLGSERTVKFPKERRRRWYPWLGR